MQQCLLIWFFFQMKQTYLIRHKRAFEEPIILQPLIQKFYLFVLFSISTPTLTTIQWMQTHSLASVYCDVVELLKNQLIRWHGNVEFVTAAAFRCDIFWTSHSHQQNRWAVEGQMLKNIESKTWVLKFFGNYKDFHFKY